MRMRWYLGPHVGLMAAGVLFAGCAVLGSEQGAESSTAAGRVTSTAGQSVLAFAPDSGTLWRADAAGLGRWDTQEGWVGLPLPEAASLTGLAVLPEREDTLYISGPGFGVLRSDDGGHSWKDANAGLTDLAVTALALHSYRLETLFAWVEGVGIHRTEDGGKSWTRMPDQGPPDGDVRALVHSTLPGSMNTGWLYASTPSGAYLSMDCF